MTPFKKILIPTDGSEYTKEAIKKGLELAMTSEADVTALYVVDQTSFINFPMDSTIPFWRMKGRMRWSTCALLVQAWA